MKEVAHYIEQLLLRHDCVIIPGLGGFVAQDSPASYVKEEEIFLPPYRSVSFNQSLAMNDGIFVHEVADDLGVSYGEALLMVRQEVNNIKQNLHRDGSLHIPGIGCLLLTEEGNYDFEPLLCGVPSPDHYGLDCVYVQTVGREDETKVVPISTGEAETERDSYSFKIRGGSVIGYAVAVVVAALIYFGCIAPIQTAQTDGYAEAGVMSHVWAFVTAKAGTEPASVDVKNFKPAAAPLEAPRAAKDAHATKRHGGTGRADYVPRPNAPFTVVIASAVPEAGAYGMARDLRRSGVKGARVLFDCGMYRVVCGAYASEGEAHEALRKLRGEHGAVFEHSWICRVR